MSVRSFVARRFAPVLLLVPIVVAGVWLSGCMQPLPRSDELIAPAPIQGCSGSHMCPYTKDGVLTEWVDQAINARLGSQIGGFLGAYAGQKALEQIPILGGWFGEMAGREIGRNVAIQASGGWEKIRESSDYSFSCVEDLAVYLYVNHSSHKHYNNALQATMDIYPELKGRYEQAIRNAPKKVPPGPT